MSNYRLNAWLVVMSRSGTLEPRRFLHKDTVPSDHEANGMKATEYVEHLDEAFIWTTNREDAAEFPDEVDPVALCLVLQERLDGSPSGRFDDGQPRYSCRPQQDTKEWRDKLRKDILR